MATSSATSATSRPERRREEDPRWIELAAFHVPV
jgi:hypothetical protein